MKRYALVSTHSATPETIDRYLPANYQRVAEVDLLVENVRLRDGDGNILRKYVLIEGEDNSGWTLDGYVIPRLASGLIGAHAIDKSHPAMKALAAATIECECSEEYGPCEKHCDILVIRDGASSHTADELTLLLVSDLVDLGVTLTSAQNDTYTYLTSKLHDNRDAHTGTAWFSDPDDAEAAVDLSDAVQANTEGLYINQDDGYTIVRPHANCPLLAN